MHEFDAVIIGAGAAGLHCAGIAGRLGLRVLVVDHAEKVAEKIRISGGGRCNFTNRDAGPANFLSANPHFCRSALARYTPQDFIALMQRHRLPFHEKHKGQLFCDEGSEAVIAMLLRECEAGGVTRWQPCTVEAVTALDAAPSRAPAVAGETPAPEEIAPAPSGEDGARFEVATSRGRVRTRRVVVACGGLSIPKIGATDFGHRLARQFGHKLIDTRPALVPLSFATEDWARFVPLAGVALPVRIATGTGKAKGEFHEDLLFTHRGLSGPAILQISSHWAPGTPLVIDLSPERDLRAVLADAKARGQRHLGNVLADHLPRRLVEAWLAPAAAAGQGAPGAPRMPGAADAAGGSNPRGAASSTLPSDRPMVECRDRDLAALAESLHRWTLVPTGTEGYRKAEVTLGGVDTRGLSSTTMESQRRAGLYFIGEVVDVTGWLGGYNFQWAWASADACARAMAAGAAAGTGGA